MSRIIHTQGTPTTQRNRLRRAIAEALRRLTEKPRLDTESKDLAAFIVFALRDMDENINRSAEAWEKRDYFIKADRFRREWGWVMPAQRLLASALRDEQWDEVPPLLAQLLPQFQDISIKKLTASDTLWAGAFERLRAEPERTPTR